ncbi:hypothetical protein CURTO8I2_320029 [Curtobacterium sp. 8I-2]|nr:hypothetical protein CURTO8I2_320029 [Curtobacterium sp. 8I-2]
MRFTYRRGAIERVNAQALSEEDTRAD